MNDEDIEKYAVVTAGEILRLKARCEALDVFVESLAIKAGLDGLKVRNALQGVTETIYQKLLEQAENVDPGLAAQIDVRKEFPDILNDFL